MKFKVGDKVRIKNRAFLKSRFWVCSDMLKYTGKIAVIRHSDTDDSYKLKIKEDIPFWWRWDMLEPVAESMKIEVYTDMQKTVVVKADGRVGKAKLAEGDKFNFFKGFEMAYNRATRDTSKWIPKYDESYYSPQPDTEDLYTQDYWRETAYDNELLNKGFVFRTKEEAIKAAQKMLEAIH